MTPPNVLVMNDLDILTSIPFLFQKTLDISSFRLVNRICYAASKNHLEYHTIQCGLYNNDLWRRLIDQPALARRVRSLTILPEILGQGPRRMEVSYVNEIVPPNLQVSKRVAVTDDDDQVDIVLQRCRESESLLIHAIRTMTNLLVFNWDANPPVIGDTKSPCTGKYADDIVGVISIWQALSTLPNLVDFRAVDLSCDLYIRPWRKVASSSIVTCGVRTVSQQTRNSVCSRSLSTHAFLFQLWKLRHLKHLRLALLWKSADFSRDGDTSVPIPENDSRSRYKVLPGKLGEILQRCPELLVRVQTPSCHSRCCN